MGTLKVNNQALTVATNGGIFLANQDTPRGSTTIVDFAKAINDDSAVPEGWELIANSSRENLPTFEVDAGDNTTLGSWGNSVIRTVYGTSTVTLEFHPMQFDADGLAKLLNSNKNSDGTGAILKSGNWNFSTAIVVAIVDSGYASGYYIPAADCLLTGLPELATDAFSELGMTATLKGASPSAIPVAGDGTPALAEIFQPVSMV